ncbi:MAG TPA: Rne/Rng family ribonuclease [Caulobacteraceae bacterium]
MSKRMLIDAGHAEETRVVVVDGTRVEEFDFESRAKKQLRGNIYLAKVTRVEPSLQAAFVEYGGNRHGFLAFNEIHPDYYQIPLADREALMREEAEDDDDDHHHHHHANGENGDGDDHAGDDEDDVMEEELARRRRRLMRRYKIQEVIKRRQIMLIQVVKEERGNKGAALTTYLSLAGRYCVLMPNTARGGGVSRKITSASDRKRLKGVITSMDVPDGMGLIVRTAGAKRTKAEIKRDYEYLSRLWENIRDVTLKSVAPALIYEEEDLVKRAIRDMYDKDLDGIVVEGEDGYREAKDFMRMLMPSQAKKITAHREATPLFIKSRVEDTLAQIYSPVVPLRSGGYLVINQTEALVAIDVNSGKATRERNIEATALKTNMEAAEEAARQMRLRDLAGLIVIDFIDMEEAKNNRAVEKKVKDSLKDDRARIQMGKISQFGLMEISRQRRRAGVLEGTTHVCPHCQGMGRVRSVESSALSMLRSVELEAAKNGPGVIHLRVPSAVALYILNEKRAYLMRLQQQQGLTVNVLVDDNLADVDHEIERITTLTGEEAQAFVAPARALPEPEEDEPDVIDEAEEDEDEEIEDEDEAEIEAEDTDDDEAASRQPAREGRDEGGRGGRRRRRRRGGRRDEVEEHRAEGGEVREEAEGEAEGEDDEGEDRNGRRRRRRGRRGGRRAREEVRAADPYSWVRVRVPHVDGVYGWYDPALAMPQARPNEAHPNEARPSEARAESRAEPAQAVAAPRAAAPTGPEADIWVELPAAEDKPGRSRRNRSRGRARSAEAVPADVAEEAVIEAAAPEAVVEVAPEPVPEAAPEPAAEPAPAPKRTRSRKKAVPAPDVAEEAVIAAAEPVAIVETVLEVAPQPVAPEPVAPEPVAPEPVAAEPRAPEPVAAEPVAAEPDPNEISTPPAQPKRGWWRR